MTEAVHPTYRPKSIELPHCFSPHHGAPKGRCGFPTAPSLKETPLLAAVTCLNPIIH